MADPTSGESLQLWATYYYAPMVPHDPNGIDLLDPKGQPTGFKLSSCDWCKASIEGTVFIVKDGKRNTLNYASRSTHLQHDCRTCEKYSNYRGHHQSGRVLWMHSSGFGHGVKNYRLVPFKSIAVDASYIPFGTVLYIPEARNLRYFDSFGLPVIHDGLFFAADTGGLLKGNHIDVFLGASSRNPFSFIGSSRKKTFTAYVVKDPVVKQRLEAMHK